ncbi:MAG: hypothetical protein AMXMBFR81_31120 [Chthonomonas sp.]
MAKRGRIGLGLLQWLAVPVALGALGYFVVGPRLSGTSFAQKARALELKLPTLGTREETTTEPSDEPQATEPAADRLQVESRPDEKPTFKPPRLRVTTEPKKERTRARTTEPKPEAWPLPDRAPVHDTLPDLEGGAATPPVEDPIGPTPPKRSGGANTQPQGDTLSSIESAIIQPTTAPI